MDTYNWLVYDLADHRTRDWPFLGSYMPILMIQLTYLLIVKTGGPRFMKNRKPYELKRVIQIYNMFQIVCCTLILKSIINNVSLKVIISCDHPERTYDYHAMQQAKTSWWILMLKFVELIETIFFVLRKKENQVSFLHVHHHIITIFFVWVLANHYPGGSALFPVFLNTVVHLIMYTYYLLSTFGPEWQNALAKWKNKLTMLQMIQFVLIFIHANQLLVFEKCMKTPRIVHIIMLPNLILIFKNFYDFYQKSYNKKTN